MSTHTFRCSSEKERTELLSVIIRKIPWHSDVEYSIDYINEKYPQKSFPVICVTPQLDETYGLRYINQGESGYTQYTKKDVFLRAIGVALETDSGNNLSFTHVL